MIRFPWEYIKYQFTSDMEGAGTWRGAPGIEYQIENHASGRCMHQTGSWDGFKTSAKGCQGGEDTHINKGGVIRANGTYEPFQSKDMFTMPGDILETVTSGGAGVGLPSERDPEAVRKDVWNGLVSIQRAKEIYKVVIDPETLNVDEEATKALRA